MTQMFAIRFDEDTLFMSEVDNQTENFLTTNILRLIENADTLYPVYRRYSKTIYGYVHHSGDGILGSYF